MNDNAIVVASAVPSGMLNAQIAAMNAAGVVINLAFHSWWLVGCCVFACVTNAILAVRR